MTREEAAKIVEDYDICSCGMCHQGYEDELIEAMKMAVELLDDGSNDRLIAHAIPVYPHGRLIDADDAVGHLFNGEQCLYSWDEIEEAIDATETVIPAEEGET